MPDDDADGSNALDQVDGPVLEAIERLGPEGFGHWTQAGWLAGLQGLS